MSAGEGGGAKGSVRTVAGSHWKVHTAWDINYVTSHIFICYLYVYSVCTLSYIQGMSLCWPHSLEGESSSEPGIRLVARKPPVFLSWHGGYQVHMQLFMGVEDLDSGLLAM